MNKPSDIWSKICTLSFTVHLTTKRLETEMLSSPRIVATQKKKAYIKQKEKEKKKKRVDDIWIAK
jgi:type II secretory pathway component HofQ